MVTVDAGALPSPESLENPNSRLVVIGQILCILVPPLVWFTPSPLQPVTQHAFAIVGFMVVAWITRAMDYALAGFIGCFLFWALRIVTFPVAFSGFANDTAWFLFGALLLGVVATRSGIARRIAYFVMLRVGITYPRILLSLIVTDFLLTFIVPSGIARVVIMASIALGLAEAFNSPPGSNVSRGMFLVLSYTANIFDKMIIAGAGSITARGLIEKIGGVEVLWSFWFVAFLPCSIITVLVAWWLTLKLYPPEKVALEGGYDYLRAEMTKLGSLSLLEKKAALLMTAAILLWLTDFLHHISPSVIGIGVGLFALLPRVGVLEIEDMKRLNYLPVFFVAAAISMGTVMQATKGLEILTNSVFAWMLPFMTNIITTTVVMYWTAFVYHFLLASEISMLGTSIPLVMEFAKSHGLNPLQLGMIWTFAAGGKLFAYQSGVLIVGYSYGYFAARDLVRIGAWLTVVEFVVLLLLVQFYWPLIGLQ
ncbi:MAG TPA: SLC13 family permease [Pseudolabrys sp.]|nr:SLC13 family permease [Pseudolabrys sp.]